MDILELHFKITKTTISVDGPNSKLNLDEKIISRRQDKMKYLDLQRDTGQKYRTKQR